MSLLERTLQAALASRELAVLFRDSFDASTTGLVTHAGRELVAMQEVDLPRGYGGVVVLWLDDVSRVRRGGDELARLAELYPADRLPAPANLSVDSIESVLRSVNEQFGHVTVHVEEEDPEVCFIGELLEIDGDFFRLREYGTLGNSDRSEIVLRLEDVTRVEADGHYERDLLRLFAD